MSIMLFSKATCYQKTPLLILQYSLAMKDTTYGGAADRLVASLLGRKRLSQDEINSLKKLVEDLK